MIEFSAMSPEQKERKLVQFLEQFETSIVAFSGGVDSSYLAFMVHRVMGDRSRAVTALSPSVSRMQEDLVRDFVARYDLNHSFVKTAEMEDENYSSNPSNRCYFCKSELYDYLSRLKEDWEVDVVFDGNNADDEGDYRPGRQAASERAVLSPLIEVGMTKEEIRLRSRAWELPTWDLPAMPCLSSRLPYGVEVTPEKLRQVEKSEEYLRSLGFREFRVRHHEELARIEIAAGEIQGILSPELFERINVELKRIGYSYVTLDLQGFRSGSLNELLEIEA